MQKIKDYVVIKKDLLKKAGVLVGSLLLLVLSFYGGIKYSDSQYYDTTDEMHKVMTLVNKEEVKNIKIDNQVDFNTFWKAWNVINDKFVTSKDKTGDQERVWGAIKGLTASLGDPYTVFFPPEEAKIFESEISGTFDGVGMEVGIKDNTLTVVTPIKNSPAERAGVKAGYKILKINGTSTESMPVDKAVSFIRGKKGTQVTITFGVEGKLEPIEIVLTRDKINLPVVTSEDRPIAIPVKKKDATGAVITPKKDKDGNIIVKKEEEKTEKEKEEELANGAYVMKLHTFSANSSEMFRESLKKFVESKSHKLIMDLRGNPGGFLDAAIEMSSWFLSKDKTIVIEDNGKERKEVKSYGYNILADKALFPEGVKIVVLVDGGSASASEILAGALQENDIAKLVGTKTFGKGSVQELVKLTPDTSLKVTIARWLTPKGNWISERGIIPDYTIEYKPATGTEKFDTQMAKAIELLSE